MIIPSNFFLSWMQNLHKFLHDKLWVLFSALPVFVLDLMQFPTIHVNSTNWYGLSLRVQGPHNYMVMALGEATHSVKY